MNMKNTLLLTALLSAGTVAVAAPGSNNLVVTSEGKALAIDISGDGNATGFQARISVTGAKNGACKLQLPGDFQGACSVKAGVVRIAGFSPSGAALPTAIGSAAIVSLDASVKSESVQVSSVEFADALGTALPFRTNVDGQAVKAARAGVAK